MPLLHRIAVPTPFPIGPVNVYLAEDDKLTLIDTGPKYAPARAALQAGLAARGCSFADIAQIILTHHHVDHLGLAAEIQALSGATVRTHAVNLPWLMDYETTRRRHADFYRAFWQSGGVPEAIIAAMISVSEGLAQFRDPCVPAQPLQEGDQVHFAGCDWRVYHTPGHAGGLICLWHAASRTLVSNDHLLKDTSSNPILEPPLPGENQRPRRLCDYLRELQRMAGLDPAIARTGHGGDIDNVHELVAGRLRFHRQRAETIFDLIGTRTVSLWQLTQEMFPALENGADFFLGISEVQGHLDLLEDERRVEAIRQQGKICWRRT
ncbi:MAG: MBL fold metallo-hydrolase [candidate division KSB1 bacterium]|nr:MBL fold metallo-hydrolase [candidate division KSB1 bacterium]MDZ7275712.1 MBL fold metallo-hydrolase [candidate division KSB1 bacterium]MDZ7284597.1 MBL fold metallo-hydrolase [candidate division KSB1 bacterium]MDZ7297984.1 MBL fold metallo-hydrolase [candidate division KSB1 bacterium]MDZ7305848.1 MBL fold metallo-hydrolase [candidate division KSB1 bacterium]